MLDPTSYREAMAHLGAAVNVVTTNGPAGRAGFTASAVCSVTDTPPTLLVCMNRKAFQHDRFTRNGILCVNILASGQEELSKVFSGATGASIEERFASAQWKQLSTGAPTLHGCLASFDCRISGITEVGTHSVFFCVVEDALINGERDGLLYFKRKYHHVSSKAINQPVS